MFSGIELTAPALFLAGLQASGHCALMCGGINLVSAHDRLAWQRQQLGRVLSYTALGGIAGGIGGSLMLWMPGAETGQWLRLLLGLGLVVLALVVMRRPRALRPHCPAMKPIALGAVRRPLVRGVAWSLLPCPILYGALFVSLLAGSVAGGSLLMLAFALGTVPLLAVQQQMALSFQRWLPRLGGGNHWLLLCGLLLILGELWQPEWLQAVVCRWP